MSWSPYFEANRGFRFNLLPSYGAPDVDAIENISVAIVIHQKPLRGSSRSTVGTATEIYSLLRLLFSRAGTPFVGYSNAFSFNDPAGMCPECDGIGQTMQFNLDTFLDRTSRRTMVRCCTRSSL